MGNDEIAFFNQQLAAMLRTGIPLEAGFKQLCTTMKAGTWKTEFEHLVKDLAQGTPLADAAAASKLPPFYVQMLSVGARSGDLPGMLTLLADHYQRRHLISARLKGLMVYPLIVLFAFLLMSLGFSAAFSYMARTLSGELTAFSQLAPLQFFCLLPTVLIAMAFVLILTACLAPTWREYLCWRLPAFREAALADFASCMGLMLRRGVPVQRALGLFCELEGKDRLSLDLRRWQIELEAGAGKVPQFAQPGRCIPPLFVWVLTSAGEDLAKGFERASEIFQARARHLTDLLLYAALPIMILFLGALIIVQVIPAAQMVTRLINALGN